MPKLVFINEPFAGRVYELTLEKTVVGRGDQNTLAVHDSLVSLVHCEILVHGPEIIVRDLNSANGTFVGGVRCRQQSQLKHGQLVRIGSVEARLELDSPAAEYTATDLDTIHEMGRIMRDQRREEQKPKPADPAMKLDAGVGSTPAEHTVMLPRTARTAEKGTPPVPQKSEVQPKRISLAMAITAVLALGLAILLWIIWGRK